MKRFTILVMLIAMVSITFAQTHMYVWKNGVKTNYAISEVDSVTFGEETFDSSQGIGVFSVSEDKKNHIFKRKFTIHSIYGYLVFCEYSV